MRRRDDTVMVLENSQDSPWDMTLRIWNGEYIWALAREGRAVTFSYEVRNSRVMAGGVGYHSPAPEPGSAQEHDCPFIGGVCFHDGTTGAAIPLVAMGHNMPNMPVWVRLELEARWRAHFDPDGLLAA